jgi:phosphomevalonate kinase
VYGGVLRYTVGEGQPEIRAVALPAALVLQVYFGGSSARTSSMRERIAAARIGRSHEVSPIAREMAETAARAADAIESADAPGFVRLARAYGSLLDSLGRAANAPVVLRAHAELAVEARREDAAFLPSGAGGGDVAVWLGLSAPSGAFSARARALALEPLAISVDVDGVRRDPAH